MEKTHAPSATARAGSGRSPDRPGAAPGLVESRKKAAAEAAVAEVKDGMVLGLGTGSTVKYAIEAIGRLVDAGLDVVGVPTSRATQDLADRLAIPVATLDDHPDVDLTIDGADEVDPRLRLIKGGGGALTREKIVWAASRRCVAVVDETKLVPVLGSTFALPIEVLHLAQTPVRRALEAAGAKVSLRQAGASPYRTDNGHLILDARFASITDPEGLERELEMRPGVVCSGLFIGLCDAAYVAGDSVRVMDAPA